MIFAFWLACSDINIKGGDVLSFSSSSDGVVYVDIPIDDENAFLLTVYGDSLVVVDRLIDPNGDILIEGDDWMQDISYTGAVWAGIDLNLNWPIREVDPPLETGTYRVEIMAIDDEGRLLENVPLTGSLQAKNDPDWTEGKINVQLQLSDTIDDTTLIAIEQATERWSDIWGAVGIDLEIDWRPRQLDNSLPIPYEGSDFYLTASEMANDDQIVMIIVETIEDGDDFLGYSGGVPGAITPSPRGAILLSWLNHAGINGVFDADDIRIFGETMAHEASHYLGLFHPQDEDGSMDAHDDTLVCDTVAECADEDGDLLMFPYPICALNGCIPQERLTPNQEAALHRYVGVLNNE